MSRAPWGMVCGALRSAVLALIVVLTTGIARSDGGVASRGVPEGGSESFPALVAEGEPEAIVGVEWEKGQPRFRNAPRMALSQTSVAWSPDGKSLATASNKTVRLWDTSTGRETRRLEGHSSFVRSVAWSPDGKTLASASDDTVRLWDTSTGSETRRFEGHSSWVTSVAWGPDGTSLASASNDGTMRLWDISTGRETRRLEGPSSRVTSLAWSPDGKSLASASPDKTVRLWDTSTGRETRRLEGHSSFV